MNPSPANTANVVSQFTLSWLGPFLRLASTKDRYLQKSDVYDIPYRYSIGRTSPMVQRMVDNYRKSKLNVNEDAGEGDKLADSIPVDDGEAYNPPKGIDPLDASYYKKHFFMSMLRTFQYEFLLGGFFYALQTILTSVTPVLLSQALTAFGAGDYTRAYLWVFGLFCFQLTGSFSISQVQRLTVQAGIGFKGLLINTIYRKALRLSPAARQGVYPNGRLSNMISADATTIEFFGTFCHDTWAIPIQIVIMSALLVYYVGAAGWAGIGFMILSQFFQGYIAGLIARFEASVLKAADNRVKIVSEMLNAMKIIKLFALEKVFSEKISKAREAELQQIWNATTMNAVFYGLTAIIPSLVAVVTFVVYYVLGNPLTPAIIFPAFSLINLLRVPLLILPQVVTLLIETNIVFNRASRLLAAPELEWDPNYHPTSEEPKIALRVKNAWFVWDEWVDTGSPSDLNAEEEDSMWKLFVNKLFKRGEKKAERQAKEKEDESGKDKAESEGETETEEKRKFRFRLKDINLDIPRGKLTAICGPIGSGKSSLLSGIIGEMRKTSGSVDIYANQLTYVPQQGWLQNDTIEHNILFGNEMEKGRYNQVLEACALDKDIAILSDGDQTEIGERGVTLSGGQAARVNLARAVYSLKGSEDLIMLDDPLAAVDAHVGRHIFSKCIRGYIEGTTRVLVTHSLNVLPFCDRIIYMEDGWVKEQGSFSELMSIEGSGFANLMNEYGAVASSEEEGGYLDKVTKKEEKADKEDVVVEDDGKNAPAQLMVVEEREEGAVALRHYLLYFSYAGGYPLVFIFVFLLLTQGTRILNDYWIVWWTNSFFVGQPAAFYMSVYAVLGVAQAVFGVSYAIIVIVAGIRASRSLHQRALAAIFRSPMSFFETNPLGRILNRFSRDVYEIDRWLSNSIRAALNLWGNAFGVLVLIAYAVPPIIGIFVPIAVLYYFALRFYRNAARELKRIEAIQRSPLFAHFGESLTGMSTIRAYRSTERFIEVHQKYLDQSNAPTILRYLVDTWMELRGETFMAVIVLMTGIFGILTRINSSLLGLALSYTISVGQLFNFAMRILAEVESRMNAVERLDHYATKLDHEAPDFIDQSSVQVSLKENQASKEYVPPPEGWPIHGAVEFKNLELRYRPELEPALTGVSFSIKAGEKIGVVGRTGSGKSSLIVALYRIVEASGGAIHIDDVDISTLGLHQLRTSMAIIPQAPILFDGSIRSNLDFLGKSTDEELWGVLASCGLKSYVETLEKKLDSPVAENGENLSVGQRQLLCLARAMLMRPKILLVDEATASVDIRSDTEIQKALREEFKSSTIITIAHRLATIIDYDRIIVMDQGQLAEIGTPSELLSIEDSKFSNLVAETGPANAAMLRQMAFGKAESSETV
ncbi:P-loop containing nucleoside triphosphate hydrolase protein [Cladochytrium replicatum]|nr:P-loop containing nucleoside triphosphate hydrolase protein [Cladochytrium replicatum]